MQNNIITDLIKKENIRRFIEEHLKNDTTNLALSIKNLETEARTALLNYIKVLQKARQKLPLWYEKRLAMTPRSYEQSTAEAVARYKATLFGGDLMINLTGGLGVDDAAFATSFQRIISVDTDAALNEVAFYNNEQLGLHNIERITADSNSWVTGYKAKADLIYIDPDRRPGGQRKFSLKDSEPDVTHLLPLLLDRSNQVAVKVSPMADITACLQELPGTRYVYVIAQEGEMKELLFVIQKGWTEKPGIVAVHIGSQGTDTFSAVDEGPGGFSFSGQPVFFYEPNAAIIKARLGLPYAGHTGTLPANREGTYALSVNRVPGYSGRCFRIIQTLKGREVPGTLKMAGISKANVAKRDYPETVEQIRKRLRLKDGGGDYLFFTTSPDGEKLAYLCRKEA